MAKRNVRFRYTKRRTKAGSRLKVTKTGRARVVGKRNLTDKSVSAKKRKARVKNYVNNPDRKGKNHHRNTGY